MKNEVIGNLSSCVLTDWAKVSALSDDDIICDDESPATMPEDWANAFVCHSTEELHNAVAHKMNDHQTKEQVLIRCDTEILTAFRATGEDWQSRINEALKEWLSQHPDLSRV